MSANDEGPRGLLGVALILVGLGLSGAAGAPWPHIRGPSHDAHSAWQGLKLPWLESGPVIRWRVALGEGYSGCTVVDGRLYTQAQTRAGQFIACLDLQTGQVLWKTRYGWPWQLSGSFPGPYATPTCSENKIFFSGCRGTIGCVDAINGRMLWSFNVMEKFNSEPPGFGYACTPLVENGKVYLHVGDTVSLVALNGADGSVLWQAGRDSVGYVAPFPVSVSGYRILVSYLENVVLATDPLTGRELWRYDWSHGYDPHPAWPLYEEPYLFLASPFHHGARVLKLSRAGTRFSVEEAWRSEVISHDILSSVLRHGFIYGFDIHDAQMNADGGTKGVFKCVDLATGIERWQTNVTGAASVLLSGDKLILVNENGVVIIAEATPDAYRELARKPVLDGELCWTMPALWEGYLLVRGTKHLTCIYLGDPADLPNQVPPTPGSSPVHRKGLWSWLDTSQTNLFWVPDLGDLILWYLFNLLGVFGLGWAVSWPIRKAHSARLTVFCSVALILSLIGTPFYTVITGKLIFTWPSGLFLLFYLVVCLGEYSKGRSLGVRNSARVGLFLFVVVCVGYFLLCRILFLVMGWGFLVGFLPAYPAVWWAGREISLAKRPRPASIKIILALSVYFWISGLLIIWRMKS